MPTIQDRRLPELRLPKLERDQIVRALSEVKLPEVRVPDVRVPDVRVPDVRMPDVRMPEIDMSRIERATSDLSDSLPRVDVRKAMDDAAIRVGLRQRRRSRWPLVAGFAIVAGLIAFALSRPTVRMKVERSARIARARIDEMRAERERMSIDSSDIAEPTADAAWSDPDVTTHV